MNDSSIESRAEKQSMPVACIVGLLFFFVTGCASVERTAPQPGATVAKVPAKVSAPPAPTKQIPKKETAPSLDLKSLEKRLRETSAIGTFTKLALKNQVDDLLDQFRAHYEGREKTTLAELRQPYDLLLLKLLSLLQDSDPPLARDIVASREAIWSILADRNKFNSLS